MSVFIHKNSNRGTVEADWLKGRYSFSFGNWYDPRYMGVSSLRVINEDVVQPFRGFGKHPHDNMEILTYVLSGAVTHQDSMGNHGQVKAGQFQLMSAGTGIYHSEVNEEAEPLHLLQIWLQPNQMNVVPRYQQLTLDVHTQPNQWHPIVGTDAPLSMYQETDILVGLFKKGQTSDHVLKRKTIYLHVIDGEILVNGMNLQTGDAGIVDTSITIDILQDSHLILFDLV